MLSLQFLALMHLYKKEKHDVIIVEADANSLWALRSCMTLLVQVPRLTALQ